MSKFIEDTKEAIRKSGHSPTDIEFIGDSTRQVSLQTWGIFCSGIEVAEKKRKDDCTKIGYEVCRDLIIVFTDSSLLYRTGKYSSEKWAYLPSRESSKNMPYILDAKEIVDPDVWGQSILNVLVHNRVEQYRKELNNDLRTI